ncbi:histidine phosphatase family protein [Rhodococcus sp. 2G]|uniref:histidine phosphatase family protein n=1 Tax=unclassified Rhodococcus (in: high G+C Gram-positive bacteria) TaxID=192944 RepID=UPI0007D93609|nr:MULTISPECIES: histidine phosphatase family protein [unclassified Rhodococcus (in: high G+C Gram-positive bacteria)]APE11286.1 histidine phosphatase family protein [Rhodococcus sp. 2G]
MQLLLIRHAEPNNARAETGGADPPLTEAGRLQASRLPDSLSPYNITRLFSSPQLRALQTAEPVAERRGLDVEKMEDIAEYDYGHDHYFTIDAAKDVAPAAYKRILAGHLPDFVDGDAFRTRVLRGIDHVVDTCDHAETVALFAHGGVVNIVLQHLLELPRPLMFPIEYASVTRILVSRSGARRVASINETGHVRDTLRV